MKKGLCALALVAVFAVPTMVEAQTAWRTDAQGRKVKVQLTGKYADCLRDGKKMGFTRDKVISYCNSRNLR